MWGTAYLVFVVVLVVFWLLALGDVLFSDADEIRAMSRTAWAIFVFFLPFFGTICWFVAGRPRWIPNIRPVRYAYQPPVPHPPLDGRPSGYVGQLDEWVAAQRQLAQSPAWPRESAPAAPGGAAPGSVVPGAMTPGAATSGAALPGAAVPGVDGPVAG